MINAFVLSINPNQCEMQSSGIGGQGDLVASFGLCAKDSVTVFVCGWTLQWRTSTLNQVSMLDQMSRKEGKITATMCVDSWSFVNQVTVLPASFAAILMPHQSQLN